MNWKILICFIATAFLSLETATAQKSSEASNEFSIEGAVRKPVTITLDSLKNYPTTSLDSLVITNHLGQRKSALKNLRVIPLKTFLDKVEIPAESPKQLSEYYFVFMATDGYKVVFSWNEIFNSRLGQELYLICGKDGKRIENLDDRIAVISAADLFTGRRYVKSLKKIVVKHAD